MMSDLRSRSSNAPRRPDGLDYAAGFGLVAGILVAWYVLAGCQPARSAAEAADAVEQVRCSENATTVNEAIACQNAVRAKWAARDGGAR